MAAKGKFDKFFRWLFGLSFTAAGIFIILRALTGQMNSSSEAVNNLPLLGIFAGLLFLLPGLWVLQLPFGLHFPADPEARTMLFMGCMFFLMGTFIVVMALVDDDVSQDVPHWVGAMGGSLFALAGVYLIKTAIFDKGQQNEKSFFNLVLIALLFTCFGSIATWVSLGARELCFLPGAVLLDSSAAVLWFQVLRRLVRVVREALDQPGTERRNVLIVGAIVLIVAVIGMILMVVNRLPYLRGAQ